MPGPATYFDPKDLDKLSPKTASLVTRRRKSMGAAYRLFYSDPVEIVRGQGTRLYDAEGAEYLDAYNNVPTVGHMHPRVVEAINRQVGQLNTHTRYLHEPIIKYSEDLLATLPNELDNIMYTCTGSEANDLAMRIAKFITGGAGVIVTSEAYHGITTETAAFSPSLAGREALASWVQVVPAPDEAGSPIFLEAVQQALRNFSDSGIKPAAIIFDTIFASDGVLTPDSSVLQSAVEAVRTAGGLFIADEVQAGFGRLGHGMWGFSRYGLVPDIVTTGKPMGNGQPIAAAISRHEIVDRFGAGVRFFSTFAGNAVSIAAAQATLDVIRDENLIENARITGQYILNGLADLASRCDQIADVRGSGLFIGVEIVTDSATRQPAGDYTFGIVNKLREKRILISAVGANRNVLKIRPPLTFSLADAQEFLTGLEECFAELCVYQDAR